MSVTATSSTTRSTSRRAWRSTSATGSSPTACSASSTFGPSRPERARRDDRHAVPRHRVVDAVQRLDRVDHRTGRCGREVRCLRDAERARGVHHAARGAVARGHLQCVRRERPDAFPHVSITPATYYENWRKKQAYLGAAIVGVQHVVDNMAAALSPTPSTQCSPTVSASRRSCSSCSCSPGS